MGSTGWLHRLYRLVWWPLSGLMMIWLWWRGQREPAYRLHLAERFGHIPYEPASLGGVWIHAASVGEVQAALTLLPALHREWGTHAVTWTVQTPAGRAMLLDRAQDPTRVFYAPLDSAHAVMQFLDTVQPRLLVLLERELWPEWLLQCERRHIQVALVNARLTARSLRRYGILQHLLQQRLQHLSWVSCANSATHQRMLAQGVPPSKLSTTGNLKFEAARVPALDSMRIGDFVGRQVVIAASTHADDEAILLKLWPAVVNRFPSCLLVLAPRHVPRFDEVAKQLEAKSLRYVRRTERLPLMPETQVLLLDTLGELAGLFEHAHLCLMGGTWAKVGGHNPMEALAQGCPVLMGPNTHQFPDLYEQIAENGAGQRVDPPHLLEAIEKWLGDEKLRLVARKHAQDFWVSQQGALEYTLANLRQLHVWPSLVMDDVMTTMTSENVTTWWNLSRTTEAQRQLGFDAGDKPDTLPTGSGRGQVVLLRREPHTWVWRHYRRGGLVAKWNPDRYGWLPLARTRAMKEFTLLREMQSMGLPVPRPIAARCERGRSHYRADILVEYIADTRNLAQVLDERRPSPEEWLAIGSAIRQMHDHQIHHSDLNCHNILLGADGKVWLIDFDKCGRLPGSKWKKTSLDRLQRSFRKESERRNRFHWNEQDWQPLSEGYRSSHL